MYAKQLEKYLAQSKCWKVLAIFVSFIYDTEKDIFNEKMIINTLNYILSTSFPSTSNASGARTINKSQAIFSTEHCSQFSEFYYVGFTAVLTSVFNPNYLF